MTGAEYKLLLQNKIDKAYSGYVSDTQWNRLVKESFYRIAERKYQAIVTQKVYDEITYLLINSLTVAPVNGEIWTAPIQIVGASAAVNVVTITTGRAHGLTNGDTVTIQDVAGDTVTLINGSFVVTVTSTTTFTYSSIGSALTNYTVGSGEVVTSNMVEDYYHYFTSYVTSYAENTTAITKVTAGSTTTVTAAGHNLRTGDSVYILAVGGVTGINSLTHEVTVVNSSKFTIGATTGTYTSGGTLQLVYVAQASQYVPMTRPQYDVQTRLNPKYKVNDNKLTYPTYSVSVALDYMRTLPFEVDVTNTTVDLEKYYNPKILYLIADDITNNFSTQDRDQLLYQTSQQQIIEHP